MVLLSPAEAARRSRCDLQSLSSGWSEWLLEMDRSFWTIRAKGPLHRHRVLVAFRKNDLPLGPVFKTAIEKRLEEFRRRYRVQLEGRFVGVARGTLLKSDLLIAEVEGTRVALEHLFDWRLTPEPVSLFSSGRDHLHIHWYGGQLPKNQKLIAEFVGVPYPLHNPILMTNQMNTWNDLLRLVSDFGMGERTDEITYDVLVSEFKGSKTDAAFKLSTAIARRGYKDIIRLDPDHQDPREYHFVLAQQLFNPEIIYRRIRIKGPASALVEFFFREAFVNKAHENLSLEWFGRDFDKLLDESAGEKRGWGIGQHDWEINLEDGKTTTYLLKHPGFVDELLSVWASSLEVNRSERNAESLGFVKGFGKISLVGSFDTADGTADHFELIRFFTKPKSPPYWLVTRMVIHRKSETTLVYVREQPEWGQIPIRPQASFAIP